MTPEDAKEVMEIMSGIERLAEDSCVLFHNRVFDPLQKMSFAAFIRRRA